MRLREEQRLTLLSVVSVMIAVLVVLTAICDSLISGKQNAIHEEYSQLQVNQANMIESQAKSQLFTLLQALSPSSVLPLADNLDSLRPSQDKSLAEQYRSGALTTQQYLVSMRDKWHQEYEKNYVLYRGSFRDLDRIKARDKAIPLAKLVLVALQLLALLFLGHQYVRLSKQIADRLKKDG